MVHEVELALTLIYTVLGIGLIIPVIAVIGGRKSRLVQWLAVLSALLAIAAGAIMLDATIRNGPIALYNNMVVHDAFTSFIVLGAGLTATLALTAAGKEPLLWESSPSYYGLLPIALFGIFVISGVRDALLLLATWLLVSVLAYVYIALPVERESRAAAVRYIMLGAVATLFLAIWVAANTVLSTSQNLYPYQIAPLSSDKFSGFVLITLLAALGFKVGIAPFHWWIPSVYGRADGRVVSVVAAVIKLGFIAVLTRLVYYMAGGEALGNVYSLGILSGSKALAYTLAILAVVTMTYGNIAALTTDDLRALLSYSSIAQIGYILAALAALAYFTPRGNLALVNYAFAAVAVQAVAYGIAKVPLFSLTSSVRTLTELRGLLGRSRAGAAGAILLFSLLGMPPMLGFWGKLYMFIAVAGFSILLVVVAFINSAISSAYYVRFARDMVSESGTSEKGIAKSVEAALVAGAILIIALGLVAPAIFSLIY